MDQSGEDCVQHLVKVFANVIGQEPQDEVTALLKKRVLAPVATVEPAEGLEAVTKAARKGCIGFMRLLPTLFVLFASLNIARAELRAGAATSNITPDIGGEVVGGFTPYPAEHIHDELHARCLVLDDGKTKLALIVCDLLGLHRSV
jgi:hypothetical protein